jgi:hypothetical protein
MPQPIPNPKIATVPLDQAPELVPGLTILSDLLSLEDADPRDLDQVQLTMLRRMFENTGVGLYLFAHYIMGYEDLTDSLHLPIARLLGRWGESILSDGSTITVPPNETHGEVVDSFRRLMVCIPRECFKTSLCTRANALWTIAKDPTHNPTVGIFNEKAENAEAWVGAIAQVVERSLLFQAIWREMIPKGIGFWDRDKGVTRTRSHKWGNTGILFERDAIGVPELSIEPHGIGGATTGKHFTHKILDDIIGHKAAESVAEMAAAVAWVDTARPLERPAENGCELVVHTPWAFADVYSHMRKKWHGEYKVHRRHILEDRDGNPDHLNGKSIFPTKMSTQKAQGLLKRDFFINMAQYQCIPRVGRDQSFDEEWFRFGRVVEGSNPLFKIRPEDFDPEILDPECQEDHAPPVSALHWMSKAVILDPAPSRPTDARKEPGSANALVAVGIDPWGRRFCLESQSLRVGPTEVLKACMTMCEKWSINTLGIEEVNFSAVYAPLFQAIIRHEYDWEPDFVPCSTKGRDKDARIKSNLIRVMENGYWYFNQVGTRGVQQQLAEYPHGDRKDEIDALSYTDEVCQRGQTPTELELTHAVERRQAWGLSGYGEFIEGESGA